MSRVQSFVSLTDPVCKTTQLTLEDHEKAVGPPSISVTQSINEMRIERSSLMV